MNKTLARFLFGIFFAVFLAFSAREQIIAAPKLTFDPANIEIAQDETKTITVRIDAENNNTIGADATITYPGGDIIINSVANGGYYSDLTSSNVQANGKLEIHGFLFNSFKSGSGILATITIKGTKTSGGGTINFSCTGANDSSKIINQNGQNILDCSSVNQVAISYTGGSAPTSTPTPTGTQNATPTPQPTAPPGQNPTCNFLAVDTNSGPAPLTVSLICAGSDPEDDIWAAEFTFGDGKKQEFSKNVGKNGSFTVAYVFGKGGTYSPSCRVRDISYNYSAPRDECKRTISVTGNTDGSGAASGVKPSPKPTRKPTPTPKGPSPTPQAVALVEYTSPTPTPVMESKKETKNFDLPRIFIGLAIMVVSLLIGGWLIFRNRRDENTGIPLSQE